MPKRSFGSTRQRASGRWQARYTGPDGHDYTARTEDGRSLTFDTKQLADKYLDRVSAAIQAGKWVSPDAPKPAHKAAAPTLRAYSETWLATRTGRNGEPLSPGTRRLYRFTLDKQVLPVLGDEPITSVTPVMIREWHAKLVSDPVLKTGPRQRAAAYSLVRTILGTAVADEILQANPCRIRGAGQAKRARKIKPASIAELEQIVSAMPARYRLMVLLGAWCALRFGELAELRRSDIDVKNGIVHVRRGVIRGDAGRVVKDPKSDAGKRDVNIPPHLMAAVKDHLHEHVAAGRDALLFPSQAGDHLSPSTLYEVYHPARAAAGRPDLVFHDLRHTGAVLAAATGATLAELMARLGHSTVSAAMRYQHAAADRDKAIAEALSKLATVTPISEAKSKRAAS